MLLRANHVLPIEAPAIKNGAVLIERGRIAKVGKVDSLSGSPAVDFGEAVILPGFVNAHTHVELSFCAGRVPPCADFTRWLERLMAVRSEIADLERVLADSARGGADAMLAAGVTAAGDITTRPDVVRGNLKHGPLRVVSYGEVIAIGRRRDRLDDRLEAAINDGHASEHLRIGVSPHAFYSVEPEAVRACVEAAVDGDLPLCMHLAETEAEKAFTLELAGPFRRLLEQMGVWDDLLPRPALPPVALASECGLLTPRTILAHCNYVSDDDVAVIAQSGAHVAYCPRTHAAFRHDPHPYRQMLDSQVNVCIGTDSLASNPSLSVLEEIRHLWKENAGLDGDLLVRMATINGARALGLSDEIGSLVSGKSADLTVVPLEPSKGGSAAERLLRGSIHPVATYVRGRRV